METAAEAAERRSMYNVVVLGLAFMFIFTAFQTGGLIQKNVLASIRDETHGRYNGDGFLSLSLIYAVFAVANWFAPSLLTLLGSRLAMVIAAVPYAIFIAQFLYPVEAGLYAASACVGIGAAVIWTAQGTFLTQNSNKSTMSRNSGIFWAMMQLSLIWGNIFVYFKFNNQGTIDADTRRFVYSGLTAVCILGNVLLVFLRRPSSVEEPKSQPFIKGFQDSLRLMKTPDMLMLFVTFIYTGLELSFFSGVYSACIGFTKALGNDRQKLVPLSGIGIGIGEVLSGAAFSIFSEKTRQLGRRNIVFLGLLTHAAAYALAAVNLPADSPFADTSSSSLIETSKYLALLGSVLLGFGDGCFNTQVYGLLGAIYSENSAPAFALFKFTQSMAAAAAFYASNYLYLPTQVGVLATVGVLGSACFAIVSTKAGNQAEPTSSQ